jgi:hypothetical protein
MESSDMRAYVERWQVVEAIEQQELQSASLSDNWRQLNIIKQRAIRLDIKRENDDGEMAIFLLWAGLKANHVPN